MTIRRWGHDAGADRNAADTPTLIDEVARQRARLRRPVFLLLAILAGLGLWLTLAARAARREADSLRAQAAVVAEQQNAAEDAAQQAGAADLSVTLDALAEHLPASLALAAAEGRPGGGIRIAIDTPDPDSLRGAFGGDPWFDRFRERSQEQHDDGSFRVVLEQR